MQYNHKEIEQKWRSFWEQNKSFKAVENPNKPKYYVLDMFPYPSGAGLHVGHPLGYIASDIIARYKRHSGFEVLHPIGFDAFGLPAEQYALDTGNHPRVFTDENINRYREQLKMLALSYDWDREVKTSDPNYYKWTQWIFIQLFNSWYDKKTNKAEDISLLINAFTNNGNSDIEAVNSCNTIFTALDWQKFSEKEQQEILLKYRLAYLDEAIVNWCPALGTVLANDEVKDGVSERGGHPVIKTAMKQWFLRITAYADRLIEDLNNKDWSDSIKEAQRNWIGKSHGASLFFSVDKHNQKVEVFTTRPDTIFGCSFLVLAPEHALVKEFTTKEQQADIDNYIAQTAKKSAIDRMSEVKKTSGCFTGSYAIHPFTNELLPIWIADYVLIQYGTGAIMAVPAHDERDNLFAKSYALTIKEVIKSSNTNNTTLHSDKEGVVIESDFLNGLSVKEAILVAIKKFEELGIGQGKVNFRLRDANFSRQRYWGEPFPIFYKEGIPYPIPEDELPVVLPDVQSYHPTGDGNSPLANLKDWMDYKGIGIRETNTMPGWAGSSWYDLRYMDSDNQAEFASKQKTDYWQSVDLYLGGSEHATGHLLYARFWHKFLFDRGYIKTPIAFKKLINQGMIQGRSSIVYRLKESNTFVSRGLKNNYDTIPIHIELRLVSNDILDIESFKNWREEYKSAEFILEDGKYLCGFEIEKMSKRWYNVVTPDEVIEKYGCDAFRMYEMFLGPIEQSKPWNTDSIDGVSRFIRKFWGLFFSPDGDWQITVRAPNKDELKTLHKTIKKVTEDIERFSLNTAISTFMICVNELSSLKCTSKAVLSDLVILISPFAPHIAEELWEKLGNNKGISQVSYPTFNPEYLIEDTINYAVQVNGKLRAQLSLSADTDNSIIEQETLKLEEVSKWLEGKQPKKVIIVPKKLVNVVI